MDETLSFLTIVSLLASPAFSDGLLWLSRAAEGEGAGLFESSRNEVVTWIVHTAMNRLVSPAFPNSVEQVVRQGFYGYTNVANPSPWVWRVVSQAVLLYALPGVDDVTGGCLYMLSGHDMQKFGVSRNVAYHCFDTPDGAYSLCFFEEWPISPDQD